MMLAKNYLSVALLGIFLSMPAAYGQPTKSAAPAEWDNIIDAAKKEGKVTVSLPASA